MFRSGLIVIALVCVAAPAVRAQREILPPETPLQQLALALRKIGKEGRLLEVTAHPDDEDDALLAYFGHGKGYRCTLLTLTRGEGGQNEIGPELDEDLAVLRMAEQGLWTYVGVALTRQLRAGVPGAWRLLVNLLSA